MIKIKISILMTRSLTENRQHSRTAHQTNIQIKRKKKEKGTKK